MRFSLTNEELTIAVSQGLPLKARLFRYYNFAYAPQVLYFDRAENRDGYIKSFGGTGNWNYCQVCGAYILWQNYQKRHCKGDYIFLSNSELISHLIRLKEEGLDISYKKN